MILRTTISVSILACMLILNSCADGNPEATCGNGKLEIGEGCDDGNGRNNDACPDGEGGTCQPARCGDGFVWNDGGGGEQCDDANVNDYDGCSAICQSEAACGDGTVDPGEGCDDGNHNNNDACPDGEGGTCQPARCGDGFIWNTDGGDETCDDGNGSINDACPDGPVGTCQVAVCGDGYLFNTQGGTELCDDANTEPGDGCSETCALENCGNGVVETGESCDDGNQSNDDSCPDGEGGTCQPARCGDGFIWNTDGGDEVCDDGNGENSDACPDGEGGTCQVATCGDGFVWNTDGGDETCDDGNRSNDDSCPDGDGGDCQSLAIYESTIVIDGVNDFSPVETFDTSSTGFTAYVAWDSSTVYIGFQGSDIASSNGTRVVSMYFGAGSPTSTTEGYLHNTQQPSLPFAATHYLFWTADNVFLQWHETDGSVWNVVTPHTVTAYQAGPFIEFAIPLSDLGVVAPFTLQYQGSILNTTSMGEWTFAANPSGSVTDGYDPDVTMWYEFLIGGADDPSMYSPLP